MDGFWLDVLLYDAVADPGAISGSVDVVCEACGELLVVDYDQYHSAEIICCSCGVVLDKE